MIKTRIVSAVMVVSFLGANTAMAGLSDQLLSGGLHILPNAALKKLIYELSPKDAERMQKKINGLQAQCSQLNIEKIRQRRNKFDSRSKLINRRGGKVGRAHKTADSVKRSQLISGEELSKVKNDHVNAIKRVEELQGYLKRVSSEIHSFLIWYKDSNRRSMNDLNPARYAFIHKSYEHLSQRFRISDTLYIKLMKNLVYLMDGKLQSAMISLKNNISKQDYSRCKKQTKRFANE